MKNHKNTTTKYMSKLSPYIIKLKTLIILIKL